MTAPQCAAGCGSPSPQAVICAGCADALRAALTMAASIAPDLDGAAARQLRHGGGGRRAGDEQPLPVDLRAAGAAGVLRMALTEAAAALMAAGHGEEYASRPMTIRAMAAFIAARVPALCQLPDAAVRYREIRRAVDRCAMVLDGPPERTYAGPCHGCGADLLGVPGSPVVTCRRCGEQADLAERQAAMRDAMDDMLGGAAWCARMAARLGMEVPESTVHSWVRRSQLVPRGSQPGRGGEPVPAYRLGDVLELIARSHRVRG